MMHVKVVDTDGTRTSRVVVPGTTVYHVVPLGSIIRLNGTKVVWDVELREGDEIEIIAESGRGTKEGAENVFTLRDLEARVQHLEAKMEDVRALLCQRTYHSIGKCCF